MVVPSAADVAARKEQAAAGDKSAQAEVAHWYFHGSYGLPVDRKEAAIWFTKAAEQGDEPSQRELAEMYEFGEGVPADHATALKWIRRAVAQYNGASTIIAQRYRVGNRAPKDARKAAEWCRISAEAGHIAAQNELGEIYELEFQDYTEAAKWYRIAANADAWGWTVSARAAAMANLGRVYAYARGVPQNYPEAVKWYERALDAGSTAASYGLGLLYEHGNGVAQDSKRAIELYYFAAPVNHEARQRLFLLYERDLPLPQDDAGAIEWYRTAAQNGDARAMAGLGLRYKFGMGVERDWWIAFALFHVAARYSPPGVPDLPEFKTPPRVVENYMTPFMWKQVDEMAKPGNLLNALTRLQQTDLATREDVIGLRRQRRSTTRYE
jgi:TPR repeat protein